MEKEITPVVRFVEGRWGRLAAYIMLFLWIASMAIADSQAYSQAPLLIGLWAVILFGLIALVQRQRLVELPAVSWVSLAFGAYLLMRASTSYSTFDAYADMGIIIGCIVFYLAGVYLAPTPRVGTLMVRMLSLALVLNMIYWLIMNKSEISLSILGRPEMGLAGEQTRHVSLFLYKNFAGAFFLLGGAALIWYSIWARQLSGIIYTLLGIISIVFSFHCGTRAIYFLAPVVLTVGWFLWFLIRFFTRGKVSWFDGIFGLGFIIATVMALYDFIYGTTVMAAVTDVDTHLRTMIWNNLIQVLPDAPITGFGAGASQWEIAPYFNEWARPNYAHNEYFQLWADYGILSLLAVIVLIVIHLTKAALLLTAEEPTHERRLAVALACFMLIGFALLSITDFVWHQFALAAATAFCLGILASPVQRKRSNLILQLLGRDRQWMEEKPLLVRAQGAKGRMALLLSLLSLLVLTAYQTMIITPPYFKQWAFHQQSKEKSIETKESYEAVLDSYPDYFIIERYLQDYPVTADDEHAARATAYLKAALEENPKNIFNLLHLVEINSFLGRFEENEQYMRRYMPRGGTDPVLLIQPHVPYGLNLLSMGLKALSNNEIEKAYSMLDYGLSMHAHQALYLNHTWLGGAPRTLTGIQRPGLRELLRIATEQRDFLRGLEISPDDSWQAPFAANEQGALYRRYVKKAEATQYPQKN